MEDTYNDIHRYLVKLEDPNKIERKRNIQKIADFLNEKFPLNESDEPVSNHREICVLWNEKLHSPLLRALRDDSERVREVSAEIVLFFFGHMANSSPMTLSYILPVLRQRLVVPPDSEVIETSEEVRLLLLKILTRILQKTGQAQAQDFKVHLDDLFQMIGSCIGDVFADVKELACDDVLLMAHVFPNDFKFNASGLLSPLAMAMTHRQKKVRIAAIKAVGCVIQQSGFDEFKLVGSHLAQRLFDPVPLVRLSVSRVAGNLLLTWREAASCCSLLIPLLLTSLEDENAETREEIWTTWSQVGMKWIKDEASRDERLKDELDFLGAADPPSHFPSEIKRPHFGCRKYISRVIYKMLPALKNDLNDWLVETRIKTSQLTYILICHLEEQAVITQHADTFLSLMFQGIKDSEDTVMKNMCRTAKIYGFFVPPKTWCPLVSQRLLVQASETDLLIFSHILVGSDQLLLRPCLEDIALTLQEDSVCLATNEDYLDYLLQCCKAIIMVSGEDCGPISSYLFKIGMSVDGLSANPDMQGQAESCIALLAEALELTLEQLFRQELGPALKVMKQECEDWTASSHRVMVFAKILNRAGSVVGYYPDLIISIFHEVLSKEVEPELQLKMYLTLSKQLYDVKNTLNSQNEFQQMALKIVTDLILPAVKWHAGRKAEAVRIAATSSLWSIFNSACIAPKDIWGPLASKLIPAMNRLLEDDAIKTRMFICQAYKNIFDQSGIVVPPDYLVKICSELLKRLDDVNDEVRLACFGALGSVRHSLPPNGGGPQFENHMRGVYSALLLHMDDSNESIRNAALDTLMKTGSSCPTMLLTLTNKALEKHIYKDQCTQLVEHLQGLKV